MRIPKSYWKLVNNAMGQRLIALEKGTKLLSVGEEFALDLIELPSFGQDNNKTTNNCLDAISSLLVFLELN